MTICIAAICSIGGKNTKIILCTDKLVSGVVQFEGAEAKCKQITPYCYAMHSSEDSRVSDLILERVAEKAKETQTTKISDLVAYLVKECQNRKKELLERDVLFSYNVTAQKLGVSIESMLGKAVQEAENYPFTDHFDFIIAGLEPNGEAHIYRIDQDGQYWCHDSLGYCTIGSGEMSAFMELTKVTYKCDFYWTTALPLVYFAKKASERSTGVGFATDIWMLQFNNAEKDDLPTCFRPLDNPQLTKILDKNWSLMQKTYYNQLNKVIQEFANLSNP